MDTKLGVSRVGGDFDTYIDIVSMYYKDGVKRTTSILSFYKEKNINDFKIEVHALKSASASIGALAISDRAKALEDAAIKGDWVFIDQNTTEFLDDFHLLLEDIRNATKAFTSQDGDENKEAGDEGYFTAQLKELEEALDCVDINQCDQILENLRQFAWSPDYQEHLSKIKDFISGYEYDEGVEYIQEVLG